MLRRSHFASGSLSLASAFAFALGFAACGGGSTASEAGADTAPSDTTPQDSGAHDTLPNDGHQDVVVDSPGDAPTDVPSDTHVSDTASDASEAGACANPDMDGDNHRSIACGGDDCDDNDPNRFPGNPEVCLYNATTMMRVNPGHDEDCDPTTYANPMTHDGDHDGDGFVDVNCLNTDRNGNVFRGTDCADIAPVAAMPASLGTSVQPGNIHPMQVEVCNGVDDNCNSQIDEGDPGGGGSCGLAAENVCRQGVNHCVMGALTCQVDYSTTGYCCMGFDDCNHNTADGCEANLQSDPLNCNGCGHACPTTGGTPVCNGGVCGYSICGAGLTQCGSVCVNVQTDPNNCNACGTVCPSTGGTPVCNAGVCGYSNCSGGLSQCGSMCVDEQTDLNNCGGCGHACPSVSGGTPTCTAGVCGGSCPSGLAVCGTMCVNEQTDVNNCGSCGSVCPGASGGTPVCTNGVCGTSCPSGGLLCGTTCVNEQTDVNNCGSCGHVCPGASGGTPICTNGVCGTNCPSGGLLCGTTCVNEQTDVNNCGSCGHACPAVSGGTPVCANGICGTMCTSGGMLCAGMCVDEQTDPNNCGGCGHICPGIVSGSPACANGICTGNCPPGYSLCGSQCVNEQADVRNCGACGYVCQNVANASVSCSAGACTTTCNPGYVPVSGGCDIPAPRPVAPLSTATVTSQQPIFRWVLPPNVVGAQVDVCADRACSRILMSPQFAGPSGTLPFLSAGLYFWRLHGVVGVPGNMVSPTWEFRVGVRSAPTNTSWGTFSDVDGDGYADVVAASPNGLVVSNGSASGVAGSTMPTSDAVSFVANAGDVNGDGFADIAAYLSSGSYSIYYGGPGGLNPTGASFGQSVYSAPATGGDVNGDGYADVIVGTYNNTSGEGFVTVYYGGPAGLDPNNVATIPEVTWDTGFGGLVVSAGDVNGDGFGDVAVADAGSSARIFLGGASGPATTPYLTVANSVGSASGLSISNAGDFNGDGYADFVLGTTSYNGFPGTVEIFLCGPSGMIGAPIVLHMGSYQFGSTVATAGDVNDDGFGDVLVGDLNQAYLFKGNAAGSTPTAITISGASQPVAGAGDINGDTYGDAVISGSVFFGVAAGLQAQGVGVGSPIAVLE